MIRAKTREGEEVGFAGQGGLVWVDALLPSDPELALLREHFPLHPLALEDALEAGHWSHYEQYPAHDFITFRSLTKPADAGMTTGAEDDEDFTERLSLFLFAERTSPAGGGRPSSVLITLRREELSYLGAVWEMVGRESVNTAQEIAFELLDEGAQTFFRFVDAFEESLDVLEERIFADERSNAAEHVFEHKHRLAQVKSLASEAQSAVTLLNRHLQAEPADQVRFRDVQDSLNRVTARLEALRDSLRGLLDLQLSLQSQRMNEVMRTLAAVSTVFLPLTFLAGVWGMNFDFLPELHWRYGYLFAWGSFVLTAVVLLAYFKRRRWW
ncbi:MAG: magnesium transporter CorA family protein [Deinococcus sp.]